MDIDKPIKMLTKQDCEKNGFIISLGHIISKIIVMPFYLFFGFIALINLFGVGVDRLIRIFFDIEELIYSRSERKESKAWFNYFFESIINTIFSIVVLILSLIIKFIPSRWIND